MTLQTLIGCIIIGLVLVFINMLVLWSGKSISRVAQKKDQSLRTILKERRSGK
jgi:hypothetical protein